MYGNREVFATSGKREKNKSNSDNNKSVRMWHFHIGIKKNSNALAV